MKKLYTLTANDYVIGTYGSKKTAIKYGNESGASYYVTSPSGQIVHEVEVPGEAESQAPVPSPEGVEKTPQPTVEEVALKHTHSFTLPGNYSIVTAPMVVELANAFGGLVSHEVKFAGKLERRVDVSSNNKVELEKFTKFAETTLADVMVALRQWQKDNIEKRRGLTDMQKFIQHRNFIKAWGSDQATLIKAARA